MLVTKLPQKVSTATLDNMRSSLFDIIFNASTTFELPERVTHGITKYNNYSIIIINLIFNYITHFIFILLIRKRYSIG